jgi:ATP-dependent DNA helicase RecQ
MQLTEFEHVYLQSHLLDSEAEKDFKLIELLKLRQGNAVVFCATGNAVDYVHDLLSAHGIESLRYHRRLRASERKRAVSILTGSKSAVLVASGEMDDEVREARVRLVVHFNYPASLAEYVAQASLAGSDGLPARCALLYYRKDKRTQKRDLENQRQVVKYAQSAMCRVQLLARPSGDIVPACQRCDNCLRTPKSRPIAEKTRIDLDALFEASL